MIRKDITLGRWNIEFYFAPDGYDADVLIDRLFDFGAGSKTLNRAYDLMTNDELNTGFCFPNPYDRAAIIAIGPTTSGEEFIDTLVHEVHHLAVAIAEGLGVDLSGESPAYLSGDAAKELAGVICQLGCKHCN